MPIRPENRDRYPPEWRSIAYGRKEAAGWRCEWCKVRHGIMIRRSLAEPAVYLDLESYTYHSADDGREVAGYPLPGHLDDGPEPRFAEAVKVIITVAHLDHTPENCKPENLRALCQRCHNRLDAPMRRAGMRERARATRASGDLFEGGEA